LPLISQRQIGLLRDPRQAFVIDRAGHTEDFFPVFQPYDVQDARASLDNLNELPRQDLAVERPGREAARDGRGQGKTDKNDKPKRPCQGNP